MSEIKRICGDLGLPVGDAYTQDWAYELPEEYRTRTWLVRYMSAYLTGNYSLNAKNELMTLALDVSNDLLSSGVSPNDEVITTVLAALFNNRHEHSELVEHWALEGEPLEDCFVLTPQVRKLNAND